MSEYDLVIRNGTVATAADTTVCDIAVRDCVVVALGKALGSGTREIDASGKLVLPGGIDSHCHIEQRSSAGVVCADDFYQRHCRCRVRRHDYGKSVRRPASRTVIAPSLSEEYHEAARPKAVIDYAFHLIISDPTEQVLGQELPALIRDGYTSFKVYMTYDAMRLDDGQMLDILGAGPARGRAGDDPRRKPRHDQMADQPPAGARARPSRATTRSATPKSPRARRPTARSRCRSSWTCRS